MKDFPLAFVVIPRFAVELMNAQCKTATEKLDAIERETLMFYG